jgi:hypothetical protein
LSAATAKPGAATANAAITTRDFNIAPRPSPDPVNPDIQSTLWRFLQSAELCSAWNWHPRCNYDTCHKFGLRIAHQLWFIFVIRDLAAGPFPGLTLFLVPSQPHPWTPAVLIDELPIISSSVPVLARVQYFRHVSRKRPSSSSGASFVAARRGHRRSRRWTRRVEGCLYHSSDGSISLPYTDTSKLAGPITY